MKHKMSYLECEKDYVEEIEKLITHKHQMKYYGGKVKVRHSDKHKPFLHTYIEVEYPEST